MTGGLDLIANIQHEGANYVVGRADPKIIFSGEHGVERRGGAGARDTDERGLRLTMPEPALNVMTDANRLPARSRLRRLLTPHHAPSVGVNVHRPPTVLALDLVVVANVAI